MGYFEGRTIGEVARGELSRLRDLAIGKVAPEIRGLDADGRPLRLGDHRGKVVVLTFSGNWCGPCRSLYGQFREMAERWEGRPFSILSVDTDSGVETLRKSIRDGEITWPCWWDGGTGGPITTAWGVTSFPDVFVIDAEGVIRFRDIRGEELDRAIASLLSEIDGGGSKPRPHP